MKLTIILVILCLYILLVLYQYNIIRYIYINSDTLSYFDIEKYLLLPKVNKKEPVVISFTTIPSRIDKSKYMIASLLDQTVRVDEICIYIPHVSVKGDYYIVPKWMRNLQKDLKGVFKIKRCSRDWGPATKIIPALVENKYRKCSIIYVDDDIIYNKDTIENLVRYSKFYPDYAICNQGWDIERWSGKSTLLGRTIHHMLKYLPRLDDYMYVFTDVMQGFSGVLVKPQFFNIKSLLAVERYPKHLFYVDDVYISGKLNNNNIKRISTLTQSGIPFLSEFINGFILRKASGSLSSEKNNDLINDRVGSICFNWIKQVKISLK